MTPGARVAAAIEILDDMATGLAAEQALTRWARRSRFAGSKDRAAVRDHVFDVLRRYRTAAHHGGGEEGRALMIGALFQSGADLPTLFTGEGHAPAPLSADEMPRQDPPEAKAVRWNLPDWLVPEWEASLEDRAEDAALALQSRAPLSLRVNSARTTRDVARDALLSEGIETLENPLSPQALTVTANERRLRNSAPYLEGLVELQDAASQAVVDLIPTAARALDYCAGGGGKALALAARGDDVTAHDADPARMVDLPARAERAGVEITILPTEALTGQDAFDVVLCDVPCSGSGAWRRAPEGKWRLTSEALEMLGETQLAILAEAARLVAPAGALVYATCSLLRAENEATVARFLETHPDWRCSLERRFQVDTWGDGFYTAHLTRA